MFTTTRLKEHEILHHPVLNCSGFKIMTCWITNSFYPPIRTTDSNGNGNLVTFFVSPNAGCRFNLGFCSCDPYRGEFTRAVRESMAKRDNR
jgi:hypothetical protein